jgi:hypothetical protein
MRTWKWGIFRRLSLCLIVLVGTGGPVVILCAFLLRKILLLELQIAASMSIWGTSEWGALLSYVCYLSWLIVPGWLVRWAQWFSLDIYLWIKYNDPLLQSLISIWVVLLSTQYAFFSGFFCWIRGPGHSCPSGWYVYVILWLFYLSFLIFFISAVGPKIVAPWNSVIRSCSCSFS